MDFQECFNDHHIEIPAEAELSFGAFVSALIKVSIIAEGSFSNSDSANATNDQIKRLATK